MFLPNGSLKRRFLLQFCYFFLQTRYKIYGEIQEYKTAVNEVPYHRFFYFTIFDYTSYAFSK